MVEQRATVPSVTAVRCSLTIDSVMEKNPWWKNVTGLFPKWEGPTGCKADGGGNHYGRGKVGKMVIHRAVNNKDAAGAYDALPMPVSSLFCIDTVCIASRVERQGHTIS